MATKAFNVTPTNTQSGLGAEVVWRGLPADGYASDVFATVFLARLRPEVEDAAVMAIAKLQESDEIMPDQDRENYRGEAWGEETGSLKSSLTYHDKSNAEAVIFSIEGDVDYWEHIEFGFTHNDTGQFIEGGHFIQKAINSAEVQNKLWAGSRNAFHMASRATMRVKRGQHLTGTMLEYIHEANTAMAYIQTEQED